MSRGKKFGEGLCVYVPYGTIEKIDKLRGPYITRSKWVLKALDKELNNNFDNTTEENKS